MKKFIILAFIACAAVTSTTSFSMFCKTLHTQKCLSRRMHATKKPFFTLPEKNIFNASERETSTNAPELLEDLFDRNQRLARHLLKEIEETQQIIKLLQHQNAMAINHTYHEEPLNMKKLHSLEQTVKKNLEENFKLSLQRHLFTLENNTHNSSDE